jgi:hypothetical protein
LEEGRKEKRSRREKGKKRKAEFLPAGVVGVGI